MDCRRRDVFLQIEPLPDYSPLAPLLCSRRYGKDCQFNEGHELGRIPAEEILGARIEGLVYREYLDADYTQPSTAPLVPSDSTDLSRYHQLSHVFAGLPTIRAGGKAICWAIAATVWGTWTSTARRGGETV